MQKVSIYCFNNIIADTLIAPIKDTKNPYHFSFYETYLYNNNFLNEINSDNIVEKKDNIISDPMFINPSDDNFHLKPNSPCIDSGYNESISLTETDMDGNYRISNGIVDLGAYEFTTNTPHPADTNENWVIESEEFTTYNTAWKNANTWPTRPNQIPAEYVTRSGFLLKKGGHYKNVGLPKPLCWMPDN